MFGFLKKNKQIELCSPVTGRAIDITTVPDKVFASKMLGAGIAFEPDEGVIYSPVDGKIVNIFPTKHAVGIRTKEGIELLIHIGFDTVQLKGEGFESLVEEEQSVKAGEEIILFDLNFIKKKSYSTITAVLITNMDKVDKLSCGYGMVKSGEKSVKVILK